MDSVTVKCSECGKTYTVSATVLGKKAKCKVCSAVFTVVAEASPMTELEQLAEVIGTPSATTKPPLPKKGFLEKMHDIADKASRQLGATYVQGPWAINANTPVTLVLDDDRLLVKSGLINKKEYVILYECITGATIDTAERLGKLRTLGTLALAGPLAAVFVGFGMKKKDRFLKLDFADDTGTNISAIFGKGPGCDIQTLQGKILERKHGRLKRIQAVPVVAAVEEQPVTPATPDVATSIETLARLRDQGLLSEDEFQAKKKELLARL